MLAHIAKQAMVAIATLIPGATYTSGSYTFTWTQLNTALTAAGVTNVTAIDSVERLFFALLALINAKQVNGTLTQYTSGCEISQQGSTLGSVWEYPQGSFVGCDLAQFLMSFRLTSGASIAGNNVVSM